jgi:hypothetical protein
MMPMKSPCPPATLSFIAALAILLPASVSAQIINIDFLSQRSITGNTESVATNYGDAGAAGGGDTFNGLSALDNEGPGGPSSTNPTDDINVSGGALLDATTGLPTTAGFSITGVGADHSGDTNAGILNGAYLFLDSANNTANSASFTISGLTSPTVTLYFYSADSNLAALGDPTITLTNGGTSTAYTGTGLFNSSDTFEFANVPVVGGEVTGTFGASHVIVLGPVNTSAGPQRPARSERKPGTSRRACRSGRRCAGSL